MTQASPKKPPIFIPMTPVKLTEPLPGNALSADIVSTIRAADAAAQNQLNTSGIRPVDKNVLVRMDPVKTKTDGGVLLPEEHADRAAQRDIEVTFVEAGARCFYDWGDAPVPTPGQRVLISRHAGMETKGRDALTYRVLSDEDVRAVIEEQA